MKLSRTEVLIVDANLAAAEEEFVHMERRRACVIAELAAVLVEVRQTHARRARVHWASSNVDRWRAHAPAWRRALRELPS